MTNSLMDQLKKAGLVDKTKQQKAKKDQQKKERMKRSSNIKGEDETRKLAKEAQQQKKERDRQLNLQKAQEAKNTAITAQIKQLIESNRLDDQGDIAYNFTHNNVVKRLYLSESIQKQLGNGRLAIVLLNERYHVVPNPVAEKIAQRDESRVIFSDQSKDSTSDGSGDEDDPYAEHQIPDDLMW